MLRKIILLLPFLSLACADPSPPAKVGSGGITVSGVRVGKRVDPESTTVAIADDNIVIILDDSGSMDGSMGRVSKMEAAKSALLTVLDTLPNDSKVGLYCLNRGWVVPVDKIDRESLEGVLRNIRPSNGTPLGASLKVGADALLSLREREHYGRYRLLVLTDGEAQDQELIDKYTPLILSRGITLDVIGVKMASAHSMAKLANSYRAADDHDALTKAINAILAESVTNKDHDESDFELIAPLNQDIAEISLAILSQVSNKPLGEEEQMGGFMYKGKFRHASDLGASVNPNEPNKKR